MDKSKASAISTRFVMFLAFAGFLGAGKASSPPLKCRRQPCDKDAFDTKVHGYCVEPFNQTMASSDYQLKCPWPSARRYYVNLTLCLEHLANSTCCIHFSYRHRMLLDIHKVYFSMCTYMQDPGIPTLLLLIMPCVIMPFIIPFFFQHFKLYEYRLPDNN